jgi:membrane-associated phospholipid phosphatase
MPGAGRIVWDLSNANLTDQIYILFLIVITPWILISDRVEHRWWLAGINVACLLLIRILQLWAERSMVGEFLHDWYPLGMFIVCFEEVSRLSFLVRDGWQDGYILAIESHLFPVPPTVWLGRLGSWRATEVLEVGYFSYFVLLMIVGGVLYGRGDKRRFRQLTDATVLAYLICYLMFIFFPTEGPAHTLAARHNFPLPGGGPFHWMVQLIQSNAGVHGNAFPSAHVAGGVVALFFAWKYVPRLGLGLTPLVVLLCIGAVYDRYHYVSDVIAGIVVGLAASTVMVRGGLAELASLIRRVIRSIPLQASKLIAHELHLWT